MSDYYDDPDLIGAAGYIFQTPVRARRSKPDAVDQAKRARRRKPGSMARLAAAAVARVARKKPEVMVKISGKAKGAKHLREHLAYITRNGKLLAEVGDAEAEASADTGLLQGSAEVRDIAAEWHARNSPNGRRDSNDSVNIVLSMPEGIDRQAVAAAASAFAKAQFGGRFDYLLVHHDDTKHPHAHLTVRARNEAGQRLNPRKADLQLWREQFARHLRAQGVDAAATPRRSRGVVQKGTRQPIRHMDQRKASTRTKWQIQQAIRTLENQRAGEGTEQPWRKATEERQRKIRASWRIVASALEKQGQPMLASQVREFIAAMPPVATKQDAMIQKIEQNPKLLAAVKGGLEQEPVQDQDRKRRK